MWVAFHIISAKTINVFAMFLNIDFNVSLANNFVKFWTTGSRFLLRLLLIDAANSFYLKRKLYLI